MNELKKWVLRSREEQRRHPARYLANHPELWTTASHVVLTKAQVETLERECGRYDATIPTGQFLGKLFLRGNCVCWFGIAPEAPMTCFRLRYKTIALKESE